MARNTLTAGILTLCLIAVAGCPRTTGGDPDAQADGSVITDSSADDRGSTGFPCTRPDECAMRICQTGYCTNDCVSDRECPASWSCIANAAGARTCSCTATASAELCDNVDNDCDGRVDNNARCPAAGHVCQAGACACPAGSTCGGNCVDLQNDARNCGACGNSCASGNACVAGACQCLGLDLLLAVDNSGSMRENQANLMAQLGSLTRQLTLPDCISASNPVPHPCDPANAGDRAAFPAVCSMHVAVISTDLGTPGSSVPGCANSDSGDDGWMNPIRHGQALQRHLPWLSAPSGFRPDDCNSTDQFPSFITFASGTDAASFEHDFRCNAGLYVNGCGLEQQLESIWRALIWHHPEDRPGNTDMNAGFLRDNALLAILVLSDEEDGSVRDCRYARGAPCTDAIEVFNASSSRWSSANLNLRFYMYQPGSDQDPTWSLDRYVDPRDPSVGFLGLKPGHPERVIFGAVIGVPLALPLVGSPPNQRTDWEALLGAPSPTDPENYDRRNSSTAVNEMSPEGPISMRQANADPSCAERVVPACRREGTAYDPARPPCTTVDQYFAWPARRITEVARRFDRSPLCGGRPCNNGVVTSICGNNYQTPVNLIVRRVQERLGR